MSDTITRLDGVTQTIMHVEGGPSGDCTRAALATILDMHPRDVPHFADYFPAFDMDNDPAFDAGGALWYRACRRWLRKEFGCDLASYPMTRSLSDWMEEMWGDGFYALGTVQSPRGPFQHHVVIDRHKQVVWDPHPDQDAYGLPVEWVEHLTDSIDYEDESWVEDDPAADQQVAYATSLRQTEPH